MSRISPERGQPGGHIGDYITYAYCTSCKLEWVWNANGIPSCMSSCGCADESIITINFKALSTERLK